MGEGISNIHIAFFKLITNLFLMLLRSYKCVSTDQSGCVFLDLVIAPFCLWDAGNRVSNAWIYVHIFYTFSPVTNPSTNKDLHSLLKEKLRPSAGSI
jgi:hypothetical protein